jgi:hypothetical protein
MRSRGWSPSAGVERRRGCGGDCRSSIASDWTPARPSEGGPVRIPEIGVGGSAQIVRDLAGASRDVDFAPRRVAVWEQETRNEAGG